MVIKNVITTAGINKKLLPKFKGPYEIVEVLDNDRYLINDIPYMQITRLPYRGVRSAANMKKYIIWAGEVQYMFYIDYCYINN